MGAQPSRSATTGSTRVARRTGANQATIETGQYLPLPSSAFCRHSLEPDHSRRMDAVMNVPLTRACVFILLLVAVAACSTESQWADVLPGRLEQ